MSTALMTPPQARLELGLMQAESALIRSADIYIGLTETLPSEAVIRLKELGSVDKRVGGRVINVGQIVLGKLVEFVKKHPNLSTGVALGAAVTALIGSIPILGPVLAPLALVLGVAVGAVAGQRLDEGRRPDDGAGLMVVAGDLIEAAKAFFELLIEVFQVLAAEFDR